MDLGHLRTFVPVAQQGTRLVALVVSDLCQVVNAMAFAARKFEPILVGFVDVEDALIGCHGATKPEGLDVPTLSLPPVTGFVTA